jgi:hypothetical protein
MAAKELLDHPLMVFLCEFFFYLQSRAVLELARHDGVENKSSRTETHFDNPIHRWKF